MNDNVSSSRPPAVVATKHSGPLQETLWVERPFKKCGNLPGVAAGAHYTVPTLAPPAGSSNTTLMLSAYKRAGVQHRPRPTIWLITEDNRWHTTDRVYSHGGAPAAGTADPQFPLYTIVCSQRRNQTGTVEGNSYRRDTNPQETTTGWGAQTATGWGAMCMKTA